ncbi:MAG: MFS transporter [Streptosporangiaceae bacterium]
MPPLPPLRLVRASVFAAVGVALACLAHLTASGEPVAPWTAGAGFVGALVFADLLAGHERSLWTISGVLVGGQFALHSLFAVGQCRPHPVVVHDDDAGPGMTLAHLLAALAAAWWLRRGERAVWALARRAWIRPLTLSGGHRTGAEPARFAHRSPDAPPAVTLLRHVHARRGPPGVPALR